MKEYRLTIEFASSIEIVVAAKSETDARNKAHAWIGKNPRYYLDKAEYQEHLITDTREEDVAAGLRKRKMFFCAHPYDFSNDCELVTDNGNPLSYMAEEWMKANNHKHVWVYDEEKRFVWDFGSK